MANRAQLTVCSLCRLDEHAADQAVLEGIGGVFAEQGLHLQAAMANKDDIDLMSEDSNKGSRRSSSGSAFERATGAFAQVMSGFHPPPPPAKDPPLSPEQWFKQLGVTDEQKEALLANLPASTSPPSILLLAQFQKEEFDAARLTPVQQRAWVALAAKQQ